MKKSLLLLSICSLLLTACNDDRISPAFGYTSPGDFYKNNREQEQAVTIKTDTETLPIIGKKGTELYGPRAILEHLNGDSVGLPWTVKLIELYTIKDYLLYQLPTVSTTTPLLSGGIVKISAFDSINNPLRVKEGAFFPIKLSTSPTDEAMLIYKGGLEEENFIDWATDGSSLISLDANQKYDLQLTSLGWKQVAKAAFDNTTAITFTIDGTGGENIDLWIVPTTKHALFYGNHLKVTNVPLGEEVRIIAIALNQDNDFVLFDKVITTAANAEVAINFEVSSEEAILETINSL